MKTGKFVSLVFIQNISESFFLVILIIILFRFSLKVFQSHSILITYVHELKRLELKTEIQLIKEEIIRISQLFPFHKKLFLGASVAWAGRDESGQGRSFPKQVKH